MAPTITEVGGYGLTRPHRSFRVDFPDVTAIVTVTSNPSVIRRWISLVYHLFHHHLSHLIVGLGVQWNPIGDGGADILQLCVGHRCLVIQLSHCDSVPLILRRFLKDPDHTFVGIWNGQDERRLWTSKHGLEVHKILDIRNYAETDEGQSLHRASLEVIAEECLGYEGVRLEPEISMSDWDEPVLSEEQVLQCCIDARVCFKFGVENELWQYDDDDDDDET